MTMIIGVFCFQTKLYNDNLTGVALFLALFNQVFTVHI